MGNYKSYYIDALLQDITFDKMYLNLLERYIESNNISNAFYMIDKNYKKSITPTNNIDKLKDKVFKDYIDNFSKLLNNYLSITKIKHKFDDYNFYCKLLSSETEFDYSNVYKILDIEYNNFGNGNGPFTKKFISKMIDVYNDNYYNRWNEDDYVINFNTMAKYFSDKIFYDGKYFLISLFKAFISLDGLYKINNLEWIYENIKYNYNLRFHFYLYLYCGYKGNTKETKSLLLKYVKEYYKESTINLFYLSFLEEYNEVIGKIIESIYITKDIDDYNMYEKYEYGNLYDLFKKYIIYIDNDIVKKKIANYMLKYENTFI